MRTFLLHIVYRLFNESPWYRLHRLAWRCRRLAFKLHARPHCENKALLGVNYGDIPDQWNVVLHCFNAGNPCFYVKQRGIYYKSKAQFISKEWWGYDITNLAAKDLLNNGLVAWDII